ncbi:MAG: hypothetical protein OQL19_11690 [Gammaproteobacteria bacterium]|nr:hypothetical protein [Gammaproteobacteria bacterium]
MATIAQRAAHDLRSKLSHERKLAPKVKAIFKQIAKDFKLRYSSSQTIINVDMYESDFKSVLTQRARLVADEFKKSFRRIDIKDETDDKIDEELLLWLIPFIQEQTDFILQTTDEQIKQIINEVTRDLTRDGVAATKENIAQKTSERFIRQGLARSDLISSEIVNTVAETSKFIEAGAVATFVMDGKKTWFTNIDGKERDSHHNAFGQERGINEPFDVGSSRLMFPKDRSLGAESKEIFNCRCSAIYS